VELGFFVCYEVWWPFITAQAVPEFYVIREVVLEKLH